MLFLIITLISGVSNRIAAENLTAEISMHQLFDRMGSAQPVHQTINPPLAPSAVTVVRNGPHLLQDQGLKDLPNLYRGSQPADRSGYHHPPLIPMESGMAIGAP